MNIYLDIDGVLLDKQGNPSLYVFEFLEYMTSFHTVFWLTTHCKGDSEVTIQFLQQRMPFEVIPFLQKIKPTNWRTLKTEAIDFTQDFHWFDDYVMEAEKEVLLKSQALSKFVLVDLKSNPKILSSFIL